MSLTVENLSVRFGDRAVLSGHSLTVAAGEIVCLTGPSGSGKSTLLRVIAGLTRPESGRVIIDGIDLTDVPTHRRGVGMVFQDYALFPHKDVAANVGFGLRMQRVTRAQATQRVRELLALVGLEGAGHRSVLTLSGGEQQRVALARALAPSPRVLLLDEPFGALDQELHDRLVAEVRTILKDVGITAVHVTHDTHEARSIGDRVLDIRTLAPADLRP